MNVSKLHTTAREISESAYANSLSLSRETIKSVSLRDNGEADLNKPFGSRTLKTGLIAFSDGRFGLDINIVNFVWLDGVNDDAYSTDEVVADYNNFTLDDLEQLADNLNRFITGIKSGEIHAN